MSMGEWRKAPDGKTRWWDGQAWGAELRDTAPAAPSTPSAQRAVPVRVVRQGPPVGKIVLFAVMLFVIGIGVPMCFAVAR